MQSRLRSRFTVQADEDSTPVQDVSINGHPLRCPTTRLRALGCLITPEDAPEGWNPPLCLSVDSEIVEDIRSLLDTGQLDITEQNIGCVTYAAFKHQLWPLHRHCENVYLSQLSPSTCLKLWLFSSDHGCQRLEFQSLKYVQDFFVDISSDNSWCHIDKHRVKTLIEDDQINVPSAWAVREAVQRWGNYEKGTRHLAVQELVCCWKQIVQRDPVFYKSAVPFSEPKDCSEQGTLGSCEQRQRMCRSCEQHKESFVKQTRHSTFNERQHSCYEHNVPRSCNSSALCIGLTDSQAGGNTALWELRVTDGQLEVQQTGIRLPHQLDKDTCFWFCPQTRCMYVSGGKQIWCYQEEGTEWRKIGPDIPMSRQHHNICYADRTVFVLGGYDEQSTLHPTHRVFALSKNKWKHRKGSKKQRLELQSSVDSCKCAVVGHVIYVFGTSFSDSEGKTTYTLQSFHPLDPGKNRLLPMPPFCKNGISVSRVIASGNGSICVMSSRGDVYEYHPMENRYDLLSPIPSPRTSFGAFVHDGYLYVFGGVEKDIGTNFPVESFRLDMRQKNAIWSRCGTVNRSLLILS